MTIQDIITRKEGQTFDRKSIQIEPKALAVSIVAFANADGGMKHIYHPNMRPTNTFLPPKPYPNRINAVSSPDLLRIYISGGYTEMIRR